LQAQRTRSQARPLAQARPRAPIVSHARPLADGRARSRDAADVGPGEARRLLVSGASAIVPGLGQLLDGRRDAGLRLAIPALVLAAFVALLVAIVPRLQLVATLVDPAILRIALASSLVVMAWRMLAVVHAFFGPAYPRRPGILGVAGLALILGIVAAPHALAHWYGSAAESAFGRFFSGEVDLAGGAKGAMAPAAAIAPQDGERLNVLIIGTRRTAPLTDTMMLASVDLKLGTVSLVSIPRDLVDVPLGNGDTFGPKLNSLYQYAASHPAAFPKGPMRTLEDAIGALLGVRVHYYAEADFVGFVRMVDLAGGVDVHNTRLIDDPRYDGLGLKGRGFRLEKGDHHLGGYEALAYVRSRQGVGDSDFTRAARQQEVLVALRSRLMGGGHLLFQLPELLDIFGDTVRTDVPPSLLPQLAAAAEGIDGASAVRVVIQKPLVHGERRSPYGSVQVPDLKKILAMAKVVLPAPGSAPSPWPVPKASKAPASPSPSP
jgi:LCP family protein required for cell wall assembly